eukprot:TRINITY_DN26526_c0_g1_i1.p1 TRINITY_DN26526_c0_g1~~TRINITY_DN26526_c0_g1_i1.p1  ORF type:complete len:268 (+),score=82.83 TRINITY_DN26526_c0_g1_i1:77-805(+)
MAGLARSPQGPFGVLDSTGPGPICRVLIAGCAGCAHCDRPTHCQHLGGALLTHLIGGGSVPPGGRLPEPAGDALTRVQLGAPTGEAITLELCQHGVAARKRDTGAPAPPRGDADWLSAEDLASAAYDAGAALCCADAGGARAEGQIRQAVQELRLAGVPTDRIVVAALRLDSGSSEQPAGDTFTAEAAAAATGVPCVIVDASPSGAAGSRSNALQALALLLAAGRARAADAVGLVERGAGSR